MTTTITATWTDEMRATDAALRDAVASGDYAAMFAAARAWDSAVVRMFATLTFTTGA